MDLQLLTIEFNDRELTVKGYYEEEEPTVMYYSDMSGHPGSPAYFEIKEIKFNGRNIINLLSDETIEEIQETCLTELN